MDWLDEERGKGLLWEESRLVEAALQAVFGDYLLQIGVWGPENLFLKSARTRQCYILADTLNPSASLVSSADCLAIASDSIDAVLLPHALETSADPHQLLREIDRVLRPEGHLIVLGFNSPSWWLLRQRLSDGGFLPGIDRFLGEHRLNDWLQLLGFTVTQTRFYHPASAVDRLVSDPGSSNPPLDTIAHQAWWRKNLLRRPSEQRGILRTMRSWRYWRVAAACYMVVARKEVMNIVPMRPQRFSRRQLARGLVRPSARASAPVKQIHGRWRVRHSSDKGI